MFFPIDNYIKVGINPTIIIGICDRDDCHKQLPQTAKKDLNILCGEISHILCFLKHKIEDLIKSKYDVIKPHVLERL